MRKYEYKPPRIHSGELRTLVHFFKNVPSEGPMPGGSQEKLLYKAWAKVDQVWLRDMEMAKANGTLSDITVILRDPGSDFSPTNQHYLSIDAPNFHGIKYNVKAAQPDLQNKSFINVIAEVAR